MAEISVKVLKVVFFYARASDTFSQQLGAGLQGSAVKLEIINVQHPVRLSK